MKLRISLGQVYDHEDGEEWEVLKKSKDRVIFETSDDSVVQMDYEELVELVEDGVLTPRAGDDEDDD